jgi:anti-sigma regulatory factor (Ser/Thr protein kinase)
MQKMFGPVEAGASREATSPWVGAEVRIAFPANEFAPKRARDVWVATAVGITDDECEVGLLLLSELVTNSVIHGPKARDATVEVFIAIGRDRLRAEVADDSEKGVRVRAPGPDGGYGLAIVAELATRWGAGRYDGRNVTWFELDLRRPGA